MSEVGGFTPVDEVGNWCRGWLAPTPGFMKRASHVLIDREGVAWIIDPVASPPLTAAVEGRTIGGVIQLMDRHNRHCEAVAARYDVPHLRVPESGDGTPFEVIPVVTQPRIRWVEIALWWPERHALVVADALGTSEYHRAPGETVGVHPILRVASPPEVLAGYPARHLLCGHGEGVHGPETADLIRDAVGNARGRIPGWGSMMARTALDGLRRRLPGGPRDS